MNTSAPIDSAERRPNPVVACGIAPLAWWCLLWLFLLVPSVSRGLEADEIREYQFKAGYLFNFARLIEWPTDSVPKTNSTIVIGLLEDDPATATLQKALESKVANGHPLKVILLPNARSLTNCQLFFFSRSAKIDAGEIIKQSKGASIVTVGEIENFARRGGTINLIRKSDDTLRFEVNLAAAEAANIKISSKMAGMATIVRTDVP